jgi:hypothetical protein
MQVKKDCLSSSNTPVTNDYPPQISSYLDSFSLVTEKELAVCIKLSPKSSNSNDPLPPWLLWNCLDTLLPTLTHIVNFALMYGMSHIYKQAVISPLLKKPTLDKENLANYSPISNLPFMSKVIERIVAQQTSDHLIKNNLNDPYQSAYKLNHSTETLLVHLQNEIISSMDNQMVFVLVLLDMSCAFDTVSHPLLIQRLEVSGVVGSALEWFKRYLDDRTQLVSINHMQSAPLPIPCGVPQGSVLGPLLFSHYISGLRTVFLQHNIQYHCYADDIQLFATAKPCELLNVIKQLESCISDVSKWLTLSDLALNSTKSELIVIGTKPVLSKCPQIQIRIGQSLIKPSDTVRNLGILLDKHMSLENHVNSVSRSAFSHIRLISRIRRSLTVNSCAMLVNALVFSRLDYCGSLFYGITAKLCAKLSRIIHASVRLVKGLSKFSHVSLPLRELNWLPAKQRFEKRALLLIFRAVNGAIPDYLQNHIELQSSSTYSLRSKSNRSLVVQRCSSRIGERAFFRYAPLLWNNLPRDIREARKMVTFVARLDAHLFSA